MFYWNLQQNSRYLIINPKQKISRDQIDQAVRQSEIILRENEAAFFEKIKDLPILLFSAGIADIVQAAMVHKADQGLTDNMKGNRRF